MTLHRAAHRVEDTEERQQKVHIIQGQYYVSDQPNVVLLTLLGSCVAACIHDPLARVGGMNHFLLPGADRDTNTREAERYGVHLMELLVNGLLQRGARKDRLQAKLFGGARTLERLSDIGRQNSIFAERFLKTEGIAYLGGSCGGESGRRLQFWPVSGRARQAMIAGQEVPMVVPPPAPRVDGDVEFFLRVELPMPTDADDSADRETVPVADIADRVGEALEDVGEAVHRLQTLIAPMVLEAASRNPVHLRELQDFDHISQKLKNLADFLGALALILPDDWRLDPGVAAKVLTLADLSVHLSFAEKSDDAPHEPGDFELFN